MNPSSAAAGGSEIPIHQQTPLSITPTATLAASFQALPNNNGHTTPDPMAKSAMKMKPCKEAARPRWRGKISRARIVMAGVASAMPKQ